MPKQKKVYYVTKEQYDILYNNGDKDGSFEHNGVTYTYDENATYYVPADSGQLKEVFYIKEEIPEEELGGDGITRINTPLDSRLKNNYVYLVEVTVYDSEQTYHSVSGNILLSEYGGSIKMQVCAYDEWIDLEIHIKHQEELLFKNSYGFDKIEIKIYETPFHT